MPDAQYLETHLATKLQEVASLIPRPWGGAGALYEATQQHWGRNTLKYYCVCLGNTQ